MNSTKLSLVFCCYNVEKYLDNIYKWLCNQSYRNIEIIFIEDSSTDSTKEKLDSFVDGRIKIIRNKVNMGLSQSRNIGLENATGEYIGFPDPDDIFDINWLQDIAAIIDSNSPDLIITGMREDYEKDNEIEFSKEILSSFSGYVEGNNIPALINLEETFLLGYMNNKFYNREMLIKNNFKCKNLALKEDFDFNMKVFKVINNFFILNKPFYFYKKRRNSNSLTSKFVPEYFEIHLNSLLMFKELIESKGELSDSAKTLLVDRFFRYLLSAIERNTSSQANLTFKQQINWLKTVIEQDNRVDWFIQHSKFMQSKLKPLSFLIKIKGYITLVAIGHLVKYIKQYLPIFFTKLK